MLKTAVLLFNNPSTGLAYQQLSHDSLMLWGQALFSLTARYANV